MANDIIQSDFPLTQGRGQVGSNSRPLAPADADLVKMAATAAGMIPGQAFKFDASGDCIPLADLADSINAEGILSFEIAEINTDLAGGTNLTQGIVFAEDDVTKYIKRGYVYVTAGATLAKGAEVGFNPTSGKWEAQANTGMVMAAAAADGEIAEVILKDFTKSNADLESRVTTLEP